ncbi:hypothetical protein BWQ96_10071 [Gracilariopsis chorda]|uniref:VWFA domain-containing protein n=1 Tax=Gracilariopsis chorda TaxID=448386 RepID=A0A2V3IDQ9_9FLOR|nr:hypothetical protein BWQ96_10071 [Gracilariopsis chorda]|eukprot:PXF40216.1 hypothetical protein BWQ96_10071 [Gracilariopsis chorda]
MALEVISFYVVVVVVSILLPCCTAQPKCREAGLFAHVLCEGLSETQCEPAKQHGCISLDGNCTLDPDLARINPCPNNEYPVNDFVLSLSNPVSFRMSVNLLDASLSVLFLVDASPSMRDHLPKVITEFSTLATAMTKKLSAIIAVAVYAGEASFSRYGPPYLPLQSMTSNVSAVRNALQFIPSLQMKTVPRTLLNAIDKARYAQTIGWRGTNARRIVVVAGDTPGRDPTCTKSDYEPARTRFSIFNEFSETALIAASVGQPGLDGALAKLPQCPFSPSCSPVYCTPLPPDEGEQVAAGQLSALVNATKGLLLTGVDASALFRAALRVVNSPGRRFKAIDGVLYRLTAEYGYDTCGNRIVIQSPSLPLRVPALSVTTVDFSVALSENGCDGGPFVCHLGIGESRTNGSVLQLQRFLVRGCFSH